MKHKAGFVNIIGLPNVGKSTLMNELVGEKMSIITSKAQTTRHRILGFVNGENYQIVFSDTPGFINQSNYKLHDSMNRFVSSTFEDADLLIFLTDKFQDAKNQADIVVKIKKRKSPLIVVLNKSDLASEQEIEQHINHWTETLQPDDCIAISALKKVNTELLFEKLLSFLPEHPPYFDKDELTDRPERFFVSEIIREKLFENYSKEVPYSAEVGIEWYKEEAEITKIRALIFVNKKTQKPIIIGRNGAAIKNLGILSRKEIEQFLDKKVHLELFVKVKENWRNRDAFLKSFGYK